MKWSFRILTAAVLLLVCLSGCGVGEGLPVEAPGEADGLEEEAGAPRGGEAPGEAPSEAEKPSGWTWETDTPENHGMDRSLLQSLHSALEDTDIYAVLTVKDGVLVDEYYKEGYDQDSVFRLNSCSKSFTSALIGIAVDEGLIDGVDVPISAYFPQLAGSDKEGVAIRHLLEHTSGIEWYEWASGSTFWEWRQSENWVDYVLEQPMAAGPGAVFNYSTGGPHLLAAILQQAAGESAHDYARERLFAPMGMDSVQWEADGQGVTDGGNGISMTARDAAKFGQLFLNGGRWEGEQLVPRSWVELSTSRQSSGIGSSGVYGYQWWIRTFGDREYDTYYAMGHAGQFIFVVPELELVTVITSSMEQETYEPRPYFSDYVLAACA